MKLVLIKHQKDADRCYLFATEFPLKKGNKVLCDTRYGEMIGYVEDDSIDVNEPEVLNLIFKSYGVTLPLKTITGIVIEFEELRQVKNQINKESTNHGIKCHLKDDDKMTMYGELYIDEIGCDCKYDCCK